MIAQLHKEMQKEKKTDLHTHDRVYKVEATHAFSGLGLDQRCQLHIYYTGLTSCTHTLGPFSPHTDKRTRRRHAAPRTHCCCCTSRSSASLARQQRQIVLRFVLRPSCLLPAPPRASSSLVVASTSTSLSSSERASAGTEEGRLGATACCALSEPFGFLSRLALAHGDAHSDAASVGGFVGVA
jgi:hypothetical protein